MKKKNKGLNKITKTFILKVLSNEPLTAFRTKYGPRVRRVLDDWNSEGVVPESY
jgi:hypothetical protein